MTGHMETCKSELSRDIQSVTQKADAVIVFATDSSMDTLADDIAAAGKAIKPIQASFPAIKLEIEKYTKLGQSALIEDECSAFHDLEEHIKRGIAMVDALKAKCGSDAIVVKSTMLG